MQINQIHAQYNPAIWEAKKHYLWFFKESAFEAIASGIVERVYADDLQALQLSAMQMLMD